MNRRQLMCPSSQLSRLSVSHQKNPSLARSSAIQLSPTDSPPSPTAKPLPPAAAPHPADKLRQRNLHRTAATPIAPSPSPWPTANTSPTRGAPTTPSTPSTARSSSSTRCASHLPRPPRELLPRAGHRAKTSPVQVNIPQFDELVVLTLPDGTEKQGQVLEIRGSSPGPRPPAAPTTHADLCVQATEPSSRYHRRDAPSPRSS